MAEIDRDKASLFLHSPDKYVLCLDKNKVSFEKKGFFTWLKTLFFKEDYSLRRIISQLDIGTVDPQVKNAIEDKIRQYNNKHPGDQIAWKVQQAVKGHPQLKHVMQAAPNKEITYVPDRIRNLREGVVVSITFQNGTKKQVVFSRFDEEERSDRSRIITTVTYTEFSNKKAGEQTALIGDIQSIGVIGKTVHQARLMIENIIPRDLGDLDDNIQNYLKDRGVQFSSKNDPLFLGVHFPSGWSKVADPYNDHAIVVKDEADNEIARIRFDGADVRFDPLGDLKRYLE